MTLEETKPTYNTEALASLTAEYALIQAKQSDLTYSNRVKVVKMYEFLKSKGDIK